MQGEPPSAHYGGEDGITRDSRGWILDSEEGGFMYLILNLSERTDYQLKLINRYS